MNTSGGTVREAFRTVEPKMQEAGRSPACFDGEISIKFALGGVAYLTLRGKLACA